MPNKVPAVLFTGIAGINKRVILKKVAHALCEGAFAPTKADDIDETARRNFPIVELCNFAEPNLNAGAEAYRNQALGRLRRSQEAVAKAAASADTKCIFLHTHAVHFIDSQFKSWTSIAPLDRLVGKGVEVKAVVALIDNSFTLLKVNHDRHWKLTLPQLLLWRDVEQMASEVLAGGVAKTKELDERRDNFFVFSGNHPTQTLAKLVRSQFMPRMADDNLSRLYMSFSIGEVRRRLAKGGADAASAHEILAQNSAFREYFSEHFVSFDPSTIDELPMFHKAKDSTDPTIMINRADLKSGGDLWPSCANRLSPTDASAIELRTDHVREVLGAFATGAKVTTGLIDSYVRSRDFLLVDQSDGIVIFRPTISGEWSSGTSAEIQRARARSMPIAVIADHADQHAGGAFETKIADTELYVGNLSDAVDRERVFAEATNHLRQGIAQLDQG